MHVYVFIYIQNIYLGIYMQILIKNNHYQILCVFYSIKAPSTVKIYIYIYVYIDYNLY